MGLWLGITACSDDASPSFGVDDASSSDADVGIDLAATDATDADTGAPDADLPTPLCATEWRYDPVVGDEIYAFPDDYYRVLPPGAGPAILDIRPETAPWLDNVADIARQSFDGFHTTDGYGHNAGIFLRFTAPVAEPPTGEVDSLDSGALMLFELGDAPRRVPYEAELGDEGLDVYVRPLAPLRAGTAHLVVVTDEYLDSTGACIAAAPHLVDMLAGSAEDPNLQRLGRTLDRALADLDLDAGRLVAALQFTTHTQLDVMMSAADDVRARDYDWLEPPECAIDGARTRCEGVFEAQDYRDDSVVRGAEPVDVWQINVTVWMPSDRDGPVPVILGGHGINSNRSQLGGLVSRMLPLGYAVVAADALEHGDHPSRDPSATDLDALRFLGINLGEARIDTQALRGNFTQTALDRLQLIELVRDVPDVDGDELPDLDVEQLAYFGISLGAMMGPNLMALSDDIDVAVLTVGGGDLLSFTTGNPTIVPLLPLLAQMAGSQGDLDRTLLAAQALIDPADPNTYAAHVLGDRVGGLQHVPNVLMYVTVFDDTVTPDTGRALARAFDLPHVPPVIDPVQLLTVEADAPIAENVADGEATAGFFQFDRVTSGDGVVEADHDNTPYSPEGTALFVEFFESWRNEGVSVIVDPYAELETPGL